jgi:hypothetical protein
MSIFVRLRRTGGTYNNLWTLGWKERRGPAALLLSLSGWEGCAAAAGIFCLRIPIVSPERDLFHEIAHRSRILFMRIFFERTGGLAGIKLKGTLDSATLPLREAHRLQRLLKQSRFFDLPSVLDSERPGADRFNYKVTVETSDGKHTVEAAEAAIPGTMRPFLDFLTRSIR